MTPDRALPSPNYHTIGRMFERLTDLTCIAENLLCLTWRVFNGTRLEMMILRPRDNRSLGVVWKLGE
ncbi:hypothetical protein TNCV_22321 [Trichonephila clavipes]|nr:hypothetical protein TNCV_22321 [Trichonephila clavipes]